MKELAKQFIGEECIIYTITSNDGSVQGVIKEIDDGGMIIERNSGEQEIINLDFVTRIRQYPKKKRFNEKTCVISPPHCNDKKWNLAHNCVTSWRMNNAIMGDSTHVLYNKPGTKCKCRF